MMSGSTPSAMKPARAYLVHIVQLKPMIKAYSSRKMVYSTISDVVIASVYSEKKHLNKLINDEDYFYE